MHHKVPIKIAFICGSLEPGRDGVGDYTRRLSGELIRLGHLVVMAGVNDGYVSEIVLEQQEIEGTTVSVLRLPNVLSWKERAIKTRQWLNGFNPDWLSLQFVPFGFHPKGLHFGLGKFLASINSKASWHVMFHELWLGLGDNSTVKHRILGRLQRYIILDLMRCLCPRKVHTQAEPYRMALMRTNIIASILPLFGNIPRVDAEGWDGLLEPLVTKAAGKPQERSDLYLAGILGMVHPEWNVEHAVNTLQPLVNRFQKRLVLVFHGKNNLEPKAINHLRLNLKGRADVVMAGERTALEITKILQTLDLGLATSPRQIIQKSGSVAAMLEHGLPVLVTRDDWRLCGWESPPVETSSQLISPIQFSRLVTLPSRNPQSPGDSAVKRVADQLIEAFS